MSCVMVVIISFVCFLFQLCDHTLTAKFNCSVPGTLANFIEECNISTTTVIPISATTSSTIVTPSTTTMDTEHSSGLVYGSRDFYIVVGSVVFVTLACTVVAFVVCIIVCLLSKRRRPHKSQTAPLGQEGLELRTEG